MYIFMPKHNTSDRLVSPPLSTRKNELRYVISTVKSKRSPWPDGIRDC